MFESYHREKEIVEDLSTNWIGFGFHVFSHAER